MTRDSQTETERSEENLGELLRQARLKAGYKFQDLADVSGVLPGQISKLEGNQVRRPNPALLAALAEPLGLSLYQLYVAAGYKTPSAIAHLGPELEQKLRQLPPEATERLERYVDRLSTEATDRLERYVDQLAADQDQAPSS